MGSSSNDSFLWTDASNDSTNMNLEPAVVHCAGELDRGGGSKRDVPLANPENLYENEIENSHRKKKRKRTTSESSTVSQPVKKRIKLELESDADARKMKKQEKNMNASKYESPDSILNYDSDYLNIRVKQEQASTLEPQVKSKKKKRHKNLVSDINVGLVENELDSYLDVRVKEELESLASAKIEKPKVKKRHKNSNLDVGNESESQVVEEPNCNEIEDYLNKKIKQEQTSMVNTKDKKLRKKKQHNDSVIHCEVDENESQPGAIENNSSFCAEQTDMEYSALEDKFCAEETVINKPQKKKHKRNDDLMESTDFNKSAIQKKNGSIHIITKEYNDEHRDNDISVQPNDFNSNNIVSSTIINNTTLDTMRNKQSSITEDLSHNEEGVHETTRILDRIRFEDDESSNHQELTLNKISPKVHAYLKANPHLQLIAPRTTQHDATLTADNEIWILRCPRDIDYKKLRNSDLSFEGKCKIKKDGHTYDGIPNEDINRITHVAYQDGQTSIMNLPVKGCMHYRKRIPKAHIPENNNMVNNQTNYIPLPETKCRHPLLGANYKKAIRLPEVIAARLEAAKSKHTNKYEATKKKKHKKDKNKCIMEVKMEKECKLEFEPSKKNKKLKHKEDSDNCPKKSKRLKHESQSAEVWESEKAIEESLFSF